MLYTRPTTSTPSTRVGWNKLSQDEKREIIKRCDVDIFTRLPLVSKNMRALIEPVVRSEYQKSVIAGDFKKVFRNMSRGTVVAWTPAGLTHYDIRTAQEIATTNLPTDLKDVIVSPRGNGVVYRTSDDRLIFQDLDTGTRAQIANSCKGSVVFSPSGQHLAVYSNAIATKSTPYVVLEFDVIVDIYAVNSAELIREGSMAFADTNCRWRKQNDSRLIAMASGTRIAAERYIEGRSALICKTRDQCVIALRCGQLSAMEFSPSGDQLLVGTLGGFNGCVYLSNLDGRWPKLLFAFKCDLVPALAFSPNGDRFMTAVEGWAKIWDTDSARVVYEFKCAPGVGMAALAPQGHAVTATSNEISFHRLPGRGY